VLADSGHSCCRAAKQLGISRGTLHKKMKQYGLIPA
jgi:DNA-binding protein Fis